MQKDDRNTIEELQIRIMCFTQSYYKRKLRLRRKSETWSFIAVNIRGLWRTFVTRKILALKKQYVHKMKIADGLEANDMSKNQPKSMVPSCSQLNTDCRKINGGGSDKNNVTTQESRRKQWWKSKQYKLKKLLQSPTMFPIEAVSLKSKYVRQNQDKRYFSLAFTYFMLCNNL